MTGKYTVPDGQPGAAILEAAFWEAGRRLNDDETVHDLQKYLWSECECGIGAELRAAAGIEGKKP